MTEKKIQPTPPHDEESIAARQRSKRIGAALQLMRQARDGTMLGNSSFARRLPNESTAARNQRIWDRFLELQRKKNGNIRGIAAQLEREFKITRQYISREVIKPYTERITATRRK